MGPALPYVCLFCKFNVLLSILPCSIEIGGPNRGGVPAGSAVRGFVLQLLCLAFWSLPSVRVGIDRREHLYLYCNTAGAVSHGLGVVREFRRPNPPRVGDKPPRYISPFPPMDPVLYRGTGARQPACPGRSLAGRAGLPFATHPGRFAESSLQRRLPLVGRLARRASWPRAR